ncbi:TIGR02594 family protein [Bradyrhizobium sp. U87765 SZCCT0131]|uniref:TIGR02594 family protein n=1 Tax=unclassified Bradyrhizobium TaxID=2631580 RepID=UPI001BAD19AA|nr:MULTISPECIES: TIGR02594 family protein [unclassified Bradyrhizobium]MBR1220706.1 TIGR02594 family protein [Bradyrhizobium sp. U87765 SZCCT0131]MBR1260474.1 TIGR02594 family protein [Bradyrhizobium sp. U87765 SZCCT0134]MBR1307277.1 TIGR02594 family protein [Bradyrhizobium sp. U87765 SZCCT0110]MBR1321231.1 TIGR02594 family protein [Bradyrhizobium sp. U87765 SZCCT0109]MBR1349544.1 TIGR02594 family protein [Bradyrhizobium sp. U87765 SZCCT0048]
MIESTTFRLPLRHVALALCSVAIVALATPASARPSHGASRHVHSHSHGQHVRHHGVRHHGRHYRHARRVAVPQDEAAMSPWENPAFAGPAPAFGGSDVVAEARRYIGSGNPTDRRSLWCARFMNMVLQRSGHKGTGSDMARSFASYGHRVSGPQVGAIAVMSRRGGGHVGVVSGIDAKGNPIVVSGNHGRRVAEAVYPRARVYAYVMPSS